jgi:capsid protein
LLISAIKIGYFDRLGVDLRMLRIDEYCEAAHFKGKGSQFVNPLVQAQALILMCEAGHLTRQQVQDQLPDGISFEKLVQELKNENDELEAAGLPFNHQDANEPHIAKGEPGTSTPLSDEPNAPKQKPKPPGRKRSAPSRLTLALLESSTNGAH